jgi:DNA-binding LytR/AlgR family response regulator
MRSATFCDHEYISSLPWTIFNFISHLLGIGLLMRLRKHNALAAITLSTGKDALLQDSSRIQARLYFCCVLLTSQKHLIFYK